MPDRNYTPDAYRYGFNGQEKDDEVTDVTGATNTAEFWEYDTRLGRRWNMDPVEYVSQSPYTTFNSNPILYADPFGLEAQDEVKMKWNQKSKKYDEVSRNDNYGKDVTLTHYEGGKKDGMHVVTSSSGTWTFGGPPPPPNKYGGIDQYRAWQQNPGYNKGENRFDRICRLIGNSHLEIMMDFGGGGYNMFGGYGVVRSASKVAPIVEAFDESAFAEQIININKATDGGGVLMNGNPTTAIHSAMYYETAAEQGAAIFRSIAHGHMFLNGNKRTAVLAFESFAKIHRLKTVNAQKMLRIATEVAEGKTTDVKVISKMLTKKQ